MDEVELKEKGQVLTIGPTLTINQVLDAHHHWQVLLSNRKLYIDASEVQDIDAAGMQLLVMYYHAMGNQIHFSKAPSKSFIERAKALGLLSLFKLTEEGKSS